MEFTAKQIAELIQGRVEGNENAAVRTFAKIEEGVEGAISFLSNPKYTHYIYDTKSSVVLINEDVELERPVSCTLIRVKNAYECVAKLLQIYDSMKPAKTGISSLASVSEKAKIGKMQRAVSSLDRLLRTGGSGNTECMMFSVESITLFTVPVVPEVWNKAAISSGDQ